MLDDNLKTTENENMESSVMQEKEHDDPVVEKSIVNDKSAISKKQFAIIGGVVIIASMIIMAVFFKGTGNSTQPTKENAQDEKISTTEKKDYSVSLSLAEYVESYNKALRNSVPISVNKNVSDSKYISAAKVLVDKVLKNPSTAVYNSADVYEKDDYGRAIVLLDVSAQNGFGGWNRSKKYVCIQRYNKDDTFEYNRAFYFTEDKQSYDTFLLLNNFGENPADEELQGLLIKESSIDKVKSIAISSSQSFDCYKIKLGMCEHYIYVDSISNKVVSIRFSIDDAIDVVDCEKIISFACAIFTNTKNTVAKANVGNVLSIDDMIPTSNSIYYEKGFVYDCEKNSNVELAITIVDKTSYKKDLYWTPNNEERYFEALADEYVAKENYDSAITYYELAGIEGEKILAAYYGKAEKCLKNGDLENAGLYFEYAGNYKDASNRVYEVYYTAGKKFESNKDYIGAMNNYLQAGDYSDAKLKYKECNYKQGEEYALNKQYDEAADCFRKAADYAGASDKYKEVNYLRGEELLSSGEVEGAKEYFYHAKGYKDSDTRIVRYYYEVGENHFAIGEYLIAAENFMLAETYSDSKTMVLECYYLYGKENLELNYISEATTALSKCRGYKDTDDILLGYYYGESVVAVNAFIDSFSGNYFATEIEDAYDVAKNYLTLCEGYKDSEHLLEIVEKLYYVWSEMAHQSYYEASFSGMNASYSGDNIYITMPNFISGQSCNLSLTYNVTDNTFSAEITHMFNNSARELDARRSILALIVLFTNIKGVEDLESKFIDKNNWEISENEESFVMSYGGYNISVTTQSEAYGYIDCQVLAKKN